MALPLLAQTSTIRCRQNLLSHFLLGISLTNILLTTSACSSITNFDAAKKWRLDTTEYLYQIPL